MIVAQKSDINNIIVGGQSIPAESIFDFEWMRKADQHTLERIYSIARLAAMCDLEKGWDGKNARPISKDIISFVGGVLLRVKDQPRIYPTAEGGVQLQYEKPDQTYLEIVFSYEGIVGMRVDQGKADEAVFSDFGYESEKQVAEYIGVFNEAC